MNTTTTTVDEFMAAMDAPPSLTTRPQITVDQQSVKVEGEDNCDGFVHAMRHGDRICIDAAGAIVLTHGLVAAWAKALLALTESLEAGK